MKLVVYSTFLFILAAAPAFSADPLTTMVGVLMDAQCSAIAGGSRHSDDAVQTVSIRQKTPSREGTRGRSSAARKKTSEPDRYDRCKATASTTEFAIHTDGQLFLLDTTGNDLVRQQMRNETFRSSLSTEAGEPRWLTVMVEGRPSGETLEVVSLRR